MPKLNQIIAVANGKKSRHRSTITHLYHEAQRGERFLGMSKSYRPKDEDGDQLPSEENRIESRASELIEAFSESCEDTWDTIAEQETTNTVAKANIVVNDKVLAKDVPVTVLLFLEKSCVDLLTFIRSLPVLPTNEKWEFNESADCYATPTKETTRTKKVPRNHEKAPATKEHPAQVEMYYEDVVAGYWETIRFCSGIPAKEQNEMAARATELLEAIQKAREEANGTTVSKVKVAKPLLDFVFTGTSDENSAVSV